MAKVKETLSSDLELIKELEQLRLKQKILIETLNKKNSTKLNQVLSELNSKIDFLVKIFKEANETEDQTEVEISKIVKDLSSKFDTIEDLFSEVLNKKLASFEEKINERFNILEEKIKMPNPPEFKVSSEISNEDKNIEKSIDKLDEVSENKSKKKGLFGL
jgi:uncharacterized coiled-coil protein SlyX